MSKRNIIFLDVDGVLNNCVWAMRMFDQGVRVFRDRLLYEPSLKLLKRIVDATGALIVVSSSWRLDPEDFECLREWLAKFGMAIYDKTPCMGGQRGDDITVWLDEHPGDWRYVILDDDNDMGRHRRRLVQTSFDNGLTESEANRCIRLLGGNLKYRE